MSEIVTLAKDIIAMRKYPLKNQGMRRYPAAAQQFTQMVESWENMDDLQQIVRLDTGHVLPPPAMQQVFERLLGNPATRTADILRAYGFHLVMFGYHLPDGSLQHDTDEMTDALFAEADTMDKAANSLG